MQKCKMVVSRGLTDSCEKKRSKRQRRKGKIYPFEFRLELEKVGKTTRPFRYNLNQTPYDYTVEVTNRFKGVALI